MREEKETNLEIYNTLGDRWYTAYDDPVALLREESKLLSPWIETNTFEYFKKDSSKISILDVGCGAGFFSNFAASKGFQITGVDQSEESLAVAKLHDPTTNAKYVTADAEALPFEANAYDVVVMLDFLEHVLNPERIIKEASRVLKPGGLFYFHTFNRNPLSWLVIIKGVEWFVKNTPKDLHLLKMFIKPGELSRYCKTSNLDVKKQIGMRPRLFTRAGYELIKTGTVPKELRFEFCKNTLLSYAGFAVKN